MTIDVEEYLRHQMAFAKWLEETLATDSDSESESESDIDCNMSNEAKLKDIKGVQTLKICDSDSKQ